MKDIIKTCNLTVKLLKFTLNIKIYEEFERFFFKIVWRKTLFLLKHQNDQAMWLALAVFAAIRTEMKQSNLVFMNFHQLLRITGPFE